MSLLSVLRSGLQPFAYAADKIEKGAVAVYDAIPSMFHPIIDALVVKAKQGASDAVAAADKLEAPIINAAAATVTTAFRAAVTSYVGANVEKVIDAPAVDGINRIRDALIAELHAEALYAMSKLATPAAAAAPAPAPEPQPQPE